VLSELGFRREVLTVSEQAQMDGLSQPVGYLTRASRIAEWRDEACSVDVVLRSARLPL
jgi:hypothetical protein